MKFSEDFMMVHTVSTRTVIHGREKTTTQAENLTLQKYTGNGGVVVIPEGVHTIGSKAFKNCNHITSVVIPSSVKTIAANAFYGCNRLETVQISKGEKRLEIGCEAFAQCETLKTVVFDRDMLWSNGHPGLFMHSSHVIIYGPPNSAIRDYAKREKIPFVVK